jgi:hypothetical protein
MFTSTILTTLFFYFYLITIFAFYKSNNRDKAIKALLLLVEMGIELIYEIGKAALFGVVISSFLDDKLISEYAKALKYATILYPVGFILDRLYGKGKK